MGSISNSSVRGAKHPWINPASARLPLSWAWMPGFILSTDQWSLQPFSGHDSGDDPCKPAEPPQLLVSCHATFYSSDPPPFPLLLSFLLHLHLLSLARRESVLLSDIPPLILSPTCQLQSVQGSELVCAPAPRLCCGSFIGATATHPAFQLCAVKAAPLLPTSIVNRRLSPWRPRRQLRLRQPRPSGLRRKAVSWRAPTRPCTIPRTLSPSSLSRSVQLSRLPVDIVQC